MDDEYYTDDAGAIYTVADAIFMGLAVLGGVLIVALILGAILL